MTSRESVVFRPDQEFQQDLARFGGGPITSAHEAVSLVGQFLRTRANTVPGAAAQALANSDLSYGGQAPTDVVGGRAIAMRNVPTMGSRAEDRHNQRINRPDRRQARLSNFVADLEVFMDETQDTVSLERLLRYNPDDLRWFAGTGGAEVRDDILYMADVLEGQQIERDRLEAETARLLHEQMLEDRPWYNLEHQKTQLFSHLVWRSITENVHGFSDVVGEVINEFASRRTPIEYSETEREAAREEAKNYLRYGPEWGVLLTS